VPQTTRPRQPKTNRLPDKVEKAVVKVRTARARAAPKPEEKLSPQAATKSQDTAATSTLTSVRASGMRLLRGAKDLAKQTAQLPGSTARVASAFVPLTRMLGGETHIKDEDFSRELDLIFEALYEHPLTEGTRRITTYLRSRNVLPNEGSTESLIRYVLNESVARSPIPVPQQIIDEFWTFFHELMSDPELRGLADLGLDITRLILKTYEPLLVEVINELKDIYYSNQNRMDALLRRVQVVRSDLKIIRRQIKALRYIRPFFQADPKDYRAQAQIVAQMVREFGPFFIKMAQVAAATADFLPEEIARELAVFQEDVPPMSAQEARDAIMDSFGRPPEEIYFGFDAERPIKSGSIGSVYLAKKPVMINDVEHLVPVIVKIGRHNLDREFLMGKTSIGLMLVSSQYWAPHGKLTPFLKAMTEQIDGFIEGFRGELQFEREAQVQASFSRRAQNSLIWRVPEVYSATERVIEMEYVDGAVNISRAVQHFKPRDPIAYRRDLAKKFLFTILSQIFVYQEVHGDLHPGNVMVDKDRRLHLIDWGNTIQLAGKMVPVLNYLKGALVANPDMLTDSLIAICTDPEAAIARRAEIREALVRTLDKKSIRPLSYDFVWMLYQEGPEGWLKRANTLMHLMSNTQQLGLVVRGEYLHLSRSLVAMIATLGNLYDGVPRYRALADILITVNSFPARLLQDYLRSKKTDIRHMAGALARRAVFAAPKAPKHSRPPTLKPD
jgi:predicted unusual protein kinase regulating ubiquinone biosynthesis (AarF/ABC1/UbiB family)